jgi:hypothetical protein
MNTSLKKIKALFKKGPADGLQGGELVHGRKPYRDWQIIMLACVLVNACLAVGAYLLFVSVDSTSETVVPATSSAQTLNRSRLDAVNKAFSDRAAAYTDMHSSALSTTVDPSK